MKTILELPEIDFQTSEYLTQPLKTLASYAQKFKVGRSERGVEILDYDLCRETILDRRFGTGHPKLMKVLGMSEGPALSYKKNSISFHDRGEIRRRLRIPLTQLMGPSGSERFRIDIKNVVKNTFTDIPKNENVDLIKHLCDQIPSKVYCYWVNAPQEDAEFVSRTSHIVQQVHTRDPTKAQEVSAGFEALLDYVDKRIEYSRKNLGDDLLSDLIKATDEGYLTPSELRNWVVKLAEANTDNSSHQIAIAIIELSSRPKIWKKLGQDISLIPQALREVMRYHPRSLSTSRETLENVNLDGYLIPKGEAVFPNIGAAHWNPNYFSEPEKFDINRPDKPTHLNFGGGIFSCIGRFAVTIEIEEVIAFMCSEFPNFEITKSAFSHSPMFTSASVLEGNLKTF
ncbi:MAG: cytochrome P450 [Paracoccaceae bacterium]|jgi:cytochrome P450|nr:cytochrome P450 [Paracoccaceae bacterium]